MIDELKELYGIEMSLYHKKVVAINILSDVLLKTSKKLELVSNAPQRIEALKKQKAIEYMLFLIGETE